MARPSASAFTTPSINIVKSLIYTSRKPYVPVYGRVNYPYRTVEENSQGLHNVEFEIPCIRSDSGVSEPFFCARQVPYLNEKGMFNCQGTRVLKTTEKLRFGLIVSSDWESGVPKLIKSKLARVIVNLNQTKMKRVLLSEL